MQRVPAIAYLQGSTPAFGGGASSRSDGAVVFAGGMEYDPADPRTCTADKADGTRCKAFAVNGGTVCIGHRNHAEKLDRAEGDA